MGLLEKYDHASRLKDFSGGSVVKNLPASAGASGNMGLVPGWRRSPGGGNDSSLQYSFLENPTDRGAWWAAAHGVTESDTTEHACPSTFERGKKPKI